MIRCPSCGWPTSSVVSTSDRAQTIRRRRECKRCNERWTTVEVCLSDLPSSLAPIVGRAAPVGGWHDARPAAVAPTPAQRHRRPASPNP